MAGLRSVSSARLRCARTLWTIAERPPESEAGVERGALEGGALREIRCVTRKMSRDTVRVRKGWGAGKSIGTDRDTGSGKLVG